MQRNTESIVILIDPNKIDPNDKTRLDLLRQAISTQEPGNRFLQSKIYELPGNSKQKIRFTCDLAITQNGDNDLIAYTVGQKLGEGSFGAVHRSDTAIFYDKKKNTLKIIPEENVIKFQKLNPSVAKQNTQCEDMIKEAQLLARFSKVRKFQRTKDQFWIVTEFHPGQTLDKINFKEMTIETRLAIAQDLCTLLGDLRDIVHSDLKPQNILYSPEHRRIQFVDFGMAAVVDEKAGNAVLKGGTEVYMDPAAAYTGKMSNTSDIYSLAPILALALGCDLNTILKDKNSYGVSGSFDFSELNNLPSWIRDKELRVTRHQSSVGEYFNLKGFIQWMTASLPTDRPTIEQVQRFFLHVNNHVIFSYLPQVKKLTDLLENPCSKEFHSELKLTLETINKADQKTPVQTPHGTPKAKDEKTQKLTTTQTLQIALQKKSDDKIKPAKLPKPSITELFALEARAEAEINECKQFIERAEELRKAQEDDNQISVIPDRITSLNERLKKHELSKVHAKSELESIERFILKNKHDQIAKPLEHYGERLNKAFANLGIHTKHDLKQLSKTPQVPNNIFDLYDSDQNTDALLPDRTLGFVYVDLPVLINKKLDVSRKEIETFSDTLKGTTEQYEALHQEFENLKRHLLSDKFAQTNSSGIRAMMLILNNPLKPSLAKLSEIINIAREKTTGSQLWSRASIFGKGRHGNVDGLYFKIRELGGQSLADTVREFKKMNNDIGSEKVFVHRNSCFSC